MTLPKDVVARNQAGAGGVRYLAQPLVFVMPSYKFWEALFCGVGLKTCWHDARVNCFKMQRWTNRWQCPFTALLQQEAGVEPATDTFFAFCDQYLHLPDSSF